MYIFFLYRAAVSKCPTDQSESDEYLTLEQKQNMIDTKHANIRDLICKFDIFLNYYPTELHPILYSLSAFVQINQSKLQFVHS